jgi:hypothetical protein
VQIRRDLIFILVKIIYHICITYILIVISCQIGVPEASIQPQKWHRLAITMGPEESSTPLSERSPARHSLGMFGDEEDSDDNDESAQQVSFMNRSQILGRSMGMGGRRGPAQSTRARVMQTYVDARKCATISSEKRGVLAQLDGRFAASTEVSVVHSCTSCLCTSFTYMLSLILSNI